MMANWHILVHGGYLACAPQAGKLAAAKKIACGSRGMKTEI